MLTIERSLNIYAAGIPQIISLSQYDDDFQLVFSLYTSEGVFTIPSGTTAEVMGTKVDGNGYSASASISDSTVTVTGNKQMTACAGRNVYEIVLTKSGKRLATVNFILKVERAALDADTIQSETVLKELNAIIDSAETSTQAAAEAAASAAAAAESARTLTIDPTLTKSGQAADAKAVGDEISGLKEDFEQFEGISDEVKQALLGCFAKVVWIDEHGQDYYDALRNALYASSDDWTWKYEASSGELFSANENVDSVTFGSGATETIVNGYLRFVQPHTDVGGATIFNLTPRNATKARLGARFKLASVPRGTDGTGSGFRLQLSNQISDGTGVQVFQRKEMEANVYHWVAFESDIGKDIGGLNLDTWYTVVVERTENKQIIYVDGNKIFESSTMSTNYANSNRVVIQSGGTQSSPSQSEDFVVDVDWIAYKNLDVESEWDYEWDASSQTFPQYSRALRYDFTTNQGYMYAENLVTDFDYVGDCRLYIKGEIIDYNNNPQIVIRNSLGSENTYNGFKIVPFYGSANVIGCNATGSMVNYQIDPTSEHEYLLEMINGVASFYCDNVLIASGGGVQNNAYLDLTGIYSYDDSGTAQTTYTKCAIKSMKFKRL